MSEFEVRAGTAAAYLSARGIQVLEAEDLGGGVSNNVVRVRTPAGELVLKQALGKLRVADDWRSDRSRIFREAAALRLLAPHLPEGAVPRVHFEDREHFCYAMDAAPAGAAAWKEHLLRGAIDPGIARRIGRMQGAMIRVSAGGGRWEETFGDQTVFDQLRLDPYYRTTAQRHPDLADRFLEWIEETRARRFALVHGDWSPKNFLVTEAVVTAIDFEVIHFGDPAFDAAFLLNHLLLKTLFRPQWSEAYAACAQAFWEALHQELPANFPALEAPTIRHLGLLLLARVDGKSPVEYLRAPETRDRARQWARALIERPPASLREIFPPRRATAIRMLDAWEALDSRGRPTVAVRISLTGGARGEAIVPSGASTGTHEAVERRDGDPARYRGRGVQCAVTAVRDQLRPALEGRNVLAGDELDRLLIALDGTPHKARLGANAIVGVSCAAARAAADALGIPLWQYLAGGRPACLPVPMVNILSGGWHAAHNIEFQDFLALPHGFSSYAEALHAAVAIHQAAYDLLRERGCVLTGVADEGGWGPHLESNEAALEILTRAIERAGYAPGRQVSIAIDVASSHFCRGGQYHLATESRVLSREEMVDLLEQWTARYPVLSIEDGLAEDDWEGWRLLTQRLGGRLQLLGDDFFTTHPERVARGIREGAANAVLVKMNQIGTLTETFAVMDAARAAGFRAVVSARSGETEDAFLADLAVASGAGQIKVGSITRSERLAKYNRLLDLERTSGLPFPGSSVFAGLL